MKFVGRGKDCANEPSDDKQNRHRHLPTITAAQRPPEKGGENCILGKVTKLAQRKMDRGDCMGGDVRIEPAQERHEISRRVLGGEDVSRTGQNYGNPNENRQPVFKKRAHVVCRASVSDAKIDGVSQKRPTNYQFEIRDPQ